MELFAHPAFQSAAAPFGVALVFAFLFSRITYIPAGFALPLAWLTTVWLAVGFNFQPLTSTRKIILIGIIAAMVGLALDLIKRDKSSIGWMLAVLSAAAVTWVIWPVIKRQEGAELWQTTIPAALYVAWLVASVGASRKNEFAACITGLALGIGTGVSALLGASALLGQLGSALAAASGAFILLLLLNQPLVLARSFTLTLALLSGLLGVSAVIYAKLPWFSLLPLVLVPLLVYTPFAANRHGWRRAAMMALFTLPLAGLAIGITWYVAGAPPI